MSMINDALKQAQVTQPKSLAADGVSLRAVEETGRAKGGVDYLMISLIVVIMLLSALLAYAWYVSPHEVKVRARTADVPVVAVAAPAPVVTQPAPVIAPVKAPAPVANIVTNQPVPVAAAVAPVAVVEPPKPAPVVFKLQGIIYRGNKSSALINNKTVYVGDHVHGARVIAIGSDSVTIVTDRGERRTLDLP